MSNHYTLLKKVKNKTFLIYSQQNEGTFAFTSVPDLLFLKDPRLYSGRHYFPLPEVLIQITKCIPPVLQFTGNRKHEFFKPCKRHIAYTARLSSAMTRLQFIFKAAQNCMCSSCSPTYGKSSSFNRGHIFLTHFPLQPHIFLS